ncbi:hypothetical protein C8Q75DRAFT_786777 [Abortiporus biennis]|nr:hypothetical protein C8Q75DRAFT_786777 [Abortiporus biennis]
MSTEDLNTPQYTLFKDALAKKIISKPGMLADPTTLPSSSLDDEAFNDLDDFTSFLSSEVWPNLPKSLREATHESRTSIPDLDSVPLDNTPTSFIDTLISCGLSDDSESAISFLRKVLEDYIDDATAPPPVWSKTRTKECEICEREVPLTYHHLIPRETHAKVLKKKWHPESMINSVAWLCRPCHSAVHHVASNEDLARYLYTVELLLEREDIQRWRRYASKQRFGIRRG